ncbi:MAG: substrate-binding periplasmic protein [Roseateles sp.]|uniref:substrate-binding periplasmic protein n=1 Tax=Roseateles sp. TaxID=1971397 RepID=UPI004036E4C6
MSRLAFIVPAAFVCLAGALPAAAQEKPTLRVAVSQSLSPPFVIWRDAQPVGGFDVDLVRAIAQQLRLDVELLPLPRPRVEAALASGDADLACNITPARRDAALPGPVLFETQDLLLGHEATMAPDSPEQLPPGSAVGTAQGQAHARLEPLFTDGRLKRDEAQSDEKLLRKLALNRHPYGVSSQPVVSWYTSTEPIDGLAPWRLQLGSRPYRCLVSARGRVEARQLIAAIEQLQDRGRVQQLLAGHVSAPMAVVVSISSPLRGITRQTLTEIFLGQRIRLRDGSAPEPVMTNAAAEREQFFNTVLRRPAAEYRSAWAAQQFGGRRRAPPELAGAEAIKSHLQRHAGAIGYLPLSLVDASLRIVFLP